MILTTTTRGKTGLKVHLVKLSSSTLITVLRAFGVITHRLIVFIINRGVDKLVKVAIIVDGDSVVMYSTLTERIDEDELGECAII